MIPKTDIPRQIILDKLIAESVDSKGTPITIHWSAQLGGNECFALVLEVYLELVKKGWAHLDMPLNNSQKIIYAKYADGSIAGGIVYMYNELQRYGWIFLSFTAPEHRGKGINSICHVHFENDVKRLGALSVASFVHIDNTPRLRSAAKVGLQPEFYRTYKKL
jgi:GNAT superfamily N-acetyltransferase